MQGTLVILTGAGLSAESGLGTFRDPGGLWTQYPLEDVATPEGFARNPDLVHGFYNARRKQASEAQPNAAHRALADLQRQLGEAVIIVTQNVDGLHEAAGSDVIHMHGALSRALCDICGHRWDAPLVMATHDACPSCARPATRPDVVWFGEIPYHMDEIGGHLQECAMFVAIGTSGQVYPAAEFVRQAAEIGAQTLEINLEQSDTSGAFDHHLTGPATEVVPRWVRSFLEQS